jgi:protein-tyrosine phosphatase
LRRAALLFVAVLTTGCAHAAPTWSPKMDAAARAIEPTPADQMRELPLKGVRNGRDFAGIVGARGKIPPDHFFRTATLENATEDDKKVLLAHGVKLDIDLRNGFEAARSPDALEEDPRFRYVRISLFGSGIWDWLTKTRGDLYAAALSKHAKQFREVFHELATQKEGAVVFHCAAGKDRTGLVSAMLLSLAGADREAIVRNYALSAHYLYPTGDDREAVELAILSAPASAIEEFLNALTYQYGGARAYLLGIGVSEADVETLTKRLGQ